MVQDLLARQHVDGLLLGPVPHAACRDLLPADQCVQIIEPAELDLALAFFRALGRGWKPTPVSIDTFEPGVVDEVAKALDLDRDAIGCIPYEPGQSAGDIMDRHRRFLDGAGGGYIISARTAVVRELAGVVPVLNGSPVQSTIRSQLHELATRVQSRRASAMRFAAGVFRVVGGGPPDLDRARVGLMHLLVNTAEFADAWVENRGPGGVVVFAHMALFEAATHNWTALPALRQAESTLGIRVAAGFGIGPSARVCVRLAEKAAARAEQASACGTRR